MEYSKKSLGQNFLIDKNIIKKILNLTKINNKHIVEIGPGKGALTDEIIKQKPKSLIIIEKDFKLSEILKEKYIDNKNIRIFNEDILKFDLEKIIKQKSIILGNLPYNISSQILVKLIKFKKWPPKFSDLILMFQKELGEKIIASYKSLNYGRLSILTYFRLNIINKFLISSSCFKPKPKVTSIIIHFQPKKIKFNSIDISNLEKVTNIFFSRKRKMINKSLKKILSTNQIKNINQIKLDSRPADIKPEIYYQITSLYENS